MNFEFEPDIPLKEDEDLPVKRLCVCGHTLTMHAFTMTLGGLNTSLCISCDCKKFRWSGKTEE